MATTTAGAQLSPVSILQTLNAFQRTDALKAAIELDIFTAVGEGNTTAEAIARRCQASPKGVRALCDYLVVIGFLQKTDSQYSLTSESAMFLDRRSPACVASMANFLASPFTREKFARLTDCVLRGGAVEPDADVPDHPMWAEFARSMAPLMHIPAQVVSQTLANPGKVDKVLDIAAGHGMFGVTVAKQYPQAQVTAVDWPGVLEVAKENARAAGVADRYHTLPGSAFDVDFGGDYDVALITNFLHHFDPPTNEKFLHKVHRALKPAGRAVTLEFVPNPDRVTPPEAAAFSLTMLAGTEAGDAYTLSEYQQMFHNAGFASTEVAAQAAIENVLISRKQ